jgi:taurine dioxygenase
VSQDRNAHAAKAELQTVPLSPAIGAEIIGIDLRRPVEELLFERIRHLWHEHGVLLFRGQMLEEENQVAFAERFGPLGRVINKHDGVALARHPSVMFISNVRQDGKLIGALPDGEMYFHSDQCYVERPSMATMLYSIEVPRAGGNTLFGNMYRAYETLPAEIKQRLEGMKALFVYDYAGNPTQRASAVRADAPSCVHPVVRTHPETGRKALYVNRLMTDHIIGVARDDSEQLLQYLFDHQEQRQFVYEHVWRPGDLLLWDNRCTLHARTDFDASERRLLRRVAILGDKPF